VYAQEGREVLRAVSVVPNALYAHSRVEVMVWTHVRDHILCLCRVTRRRNNTRQHRECHCK